MAAAAAAVVAPRLLHYVLKIGNRAASIHFLCDLLGMRVLRHEEFDKGCEATCNGPYAGRWSKTMVGYGAESAHFVLELTYNYGVCSYQLGNDLHAVTVQAAGVVDRIREARLPMQEMESDGGSGGGEWLVHSPDGYPFIVAECGDASEARVRRCSLVCTDVARSLQFWRDVLGLRVLEHTATTPAAAAPDATATATAAAAPDATATSAAPACSAVVLQYESGSCQLQLVQAPAVERHAAFGRTAIAWPTDTLAATERLVQQQQEEEEEGGSGAVGRVLTPLVRLETPGKAAVHVVILADADSHEVCLVGAEGFAQLAQEDPAARQLLHEAIAGDKSQQLPAKLSAGNTK